jgi:hypothetical protein
MIKAHPWMNLKNLLALLIAIVGVYLLVTTLVDIKFREIELSTRVQIADQGTLLAAIAETTARNGADTVTESIVKDCTLDERVRFDDLLGRLDGNLGKAQLVELERLFGRCGAFYSERKSVMVARLSREIEIYDIYVQQLSTIIGDDKLSAFNVTTWQALASEEKKQSDAFSQLVVLQDKIISALLDGKAATSPEVVGILNEVHEVQQTLVLANKQSTTLRIELFPL